MGVTQQELQKVQDIGHKEAYRRIKDYYSSFIVKWNKLPKLEKENYIFGNGRKGSVEYVNNSSTCLSVLPLDPSIDDSIDLAKNVICKSLEYSYHDEDEYGIKMGAYAHYIINKFNNGKL